MHIPVSLILVTFILAEIAGFILVSKAVGVVATLSLVLLGMVVGGILLRHHGLTMFARVRADVAAGRAPARPIAEDALLTIASFLILTPGFLSDLVGLSLYIPGARRAVWRAIRRYVEIRPSEQASSRTAVVDLDQSEYGVSPTGRGGVRALGARGEPPRHRLLGSPMLGGRRTA